MDTRYFAIVADRLGNCQDMGLIKTTMQGITAMTGCSKGDPFSRLFHIRLQGVIGRNEFRNIYQHGLGSRFSCQWMDAHDLFLDLQ